MTNAILLSAGQGRRLSPLTDARPKCLVPVGGRTLLEWQLHALAACGVRDVAVVTGYEARAVSAALKTSTADVEARSLFNPFYGVADNIGSCWTARDLIGEDTVLINGDTLFDRRVLARVLEEATAPITVTVDVKPAYDADDMKVRSSGNALTAIGKTLTDPIDGESIGLLRFQAGGGAAFARRMEEMLQDPATLSKWYLTIIDDMARDAAAPEVGVVRIDGLPWAEVDFLHDLPIAADRVAGFDWGGASAGAPAGPRRSSSAGGSAA
ncbi:MAG: phosphocholine cytidylyltransferase family protein [Pseudomonadota bacterium]